MPKRLFIILYLAISFVVASHAQQHDKDDIIISLSDSTKIHGTLLKSWFTPGKLNREFLMKLSDGSEKWFNSSDVDSIEFKHNKDKWAAHDIKGERWFMRCGPSTDSAEILTYYIYAPPNIKRRPILADLRFTHAIRIKGDSEIYPFYHQMFWGFNLKWIKKSLKRKYPGLVEYIEDYFKQNKDLKKALYQHPDYILQVYEDFLKNNEEHLGSNKE
ncbi:MULTISPECIES: hypothetical protein [Muribaculaceae]|jgi:hypothetical protein|uniref:hypothetical protein n=1 Tax=Muribaculaceae TaxID=2005473 RepID=UPI000F490B18|nr:MULTISPECIES: hypothetical protein [Muribaculaceae]ROS89673.1 hypothetical protein EEL39_02345 [Muribaculaceae bacterium Isolate-080 (Janvier)]